MVVCKFGRRRVTEGMGSRDRGNIVLERCQVGPLYLPRKQNTTHSMRSAEHAFLVNIKSRESAGAVGDPHRAGGTRSAKRTTAMLCGGRVARKVVWAAQNAEKHKSTFIRKTLSTQTNVAESGKCEDQKIQKAFLSDGQRAACISASKQLDRQSGETAGWTLPHVHTWLPILPWTGRASHNSHTFTGQRPAPRALGDCRV